MSDGRATAFMGRATAFMGLRTVRQGSHETIPYHAAAYYRMEMSDV